MYRVPTDPELWRSWQAAAGRSEVDQQLRELFKKLDGAVAARGPTCWTSGNCCRFDSYGHQLFVTGLELVWFLNQPVVLSQLDHSRTGQQAALSDNPLAILSQPGPGGACPFQIDNLCSTHAVRPLGCRVFFCQQGTQDWQQDLYEQFLNRLRDLHTQHDIAYHYFDWMQGLEQAKSLLTI
jgi:Fe-S-cluster containining protein